MGQSISIGKDMILGLGPFSLLSPMLILELSQRDINLLYQAGGGTLSDVIGTIWKDNHELALRGGLGYRMGHIL